MNRSDLFFTVSLFLHLTAFGQSRSLAKTRDSIHNSVAAILRQDTSGGTFIGASGVLIHPRVILTAGHVNFSNFKQLPGGCSTKGWVSFSDKAYSGVERYAFDYAHGIESYPDTAAFAKSFGDTTGQAGPSHFIDIGLIFLDEPVRGHPVMQLPDTSFLKDNVGDSSLLGAGYGYHTRMDSTFTFSSIDGLRRTWTPRMSLYNDKWLFAQCDPISNLPYLCIADSGSPLLFRNKMVVGVWSFEGYGKAPCPYSSWAVRLDNPDALSWIKATIQRRLGNK
ncbi:MAG TPA: trypsin-like serine protease [Puia sp.]|nr:trypsin-like serine protease [Puia sp.]